MPVMSDVHNTLALGRVIYTDYIYLFQLAGLILLVAMIGAITLTLRKRDGVKRISARRISSHAQIRSGWQKCSGEGAERVHHDWCRDYLAHYLSVAGLLFVFGVFGIFLNRKNVITILMSIELILLSVSINLVAFLRLTGIWQDRYSHYLF